MNLKNIFKRKKKGYAGVEDLVPDTDDFQLPATGTMNLHKTINSYHTNEKIRFYPRGLSDEEMQELREECNAKGYSLVVINTVALTLDMFDWYYVLTKENLLSGLQGAWDPFLDTYYAMSKDKSTFPGTNIFAEIITPSLKVESKDSQPKFEIVVRFTAEGLRVLQKEYVILTKEEIPDSEKEIKELLEARLNEKLTQFYRDIAKGEGRPFEKHEPKGDAV